MAVASLFTLLDDIASTLDDVAVMTKLAAQKTAGVLGDDLAVNAEQVSGSAAERELPIVFKVALGSLVNKVILVPAALLIAAFVPGLIAPLLMLGGSYLCFEGIEKVLHARHKAREPEQQQVVEFNEKERIKGAIRTDFVLSAEIIVIALGVVAAGTLLEKSLTLSAIALVMTVGVYGLVAVIVKTDDVGLWLLKKSSSVAQTIGRGLVASMPYLMKFLSVAGTVAMFLVGGSIILHNGLRGLAHAAESMMHGWSAWFSMPSSLLLNAAVGIVTGLLVYGVVQLKNLWSRKEKHS
ncbi:MAG: DUF808 domain-containing protein [Neisseria sp.]|nr:DUF808 domain-containing protein [Neisseria sp.]